MTTETNHKATTVAEQGAHVAPETAPSKKGASKKRGAPKARKTAKSAKANAGAPEAKTVRPRKDATGARSNKKRR